MEGEVYDGEGNVQVYDQRLRGEVQGITTQSSYVHVYKLYNKIKNALSNLQHQKSLHLHVTVKSLTSIKKFTQL